MKLESAQNCQPSDCPLSSNNSNYGNNNNIDQNRRTQQGQSGMSVASSSSSAGQYHIPQELQDTLLDFTVQFLVEQPNDLVEYGVAYFMRLKERRKGSENDNSDESMISDEGPVYNSHASRRKSVFAEAYNPEEDETEEPSIIHPKSDAQRRSLQEAVKGIIIFRSLEPEQLGEVLDAMFHREVEKGENVIVQGESGDNFYVIETGTYNIYVDSTANPKKIGTYEGRGSFGELALMYDLPRAATIQAVTPGTLWALDRKTFRRIVLRTAFLKRKMYESLLETVPLLTSLSEYERMNLADALVSQTHLDGAAIVNQGDPGDGMYFVEEGEVVITAVKDSCEKVLTSVNKGGYFGELALVTHKPRAATARAKGKVRVAFLDVQAFERLLGPCMDVMKRNIEDYEHQLVKIFGSKTNMSEVR